MKRILIIVCLLFLCGCSEAKEGIDRSLSLREHLLSASCSFDAQITADYGDKTYTFVVSCTADSSGDIMFCVSKPESISGVSGKITGNTGHLTFDDQALAFSLLADGEVSPVSAPWLLITTLRGGYIRSCAEEDDGLRISIDDSYREGSLRMDVWLNAQNVPVFADILWQGRRVLSVKVENFVFV